MKSNFNFGFLNIFGLFMVLVYIGAGLFVIFFEDFNKRFGIPPEYSAMKIFFGVFLILYGIFRFVRLYPKLKKDDYEKE